MFPSELVLDHFVCKKVEVGIIPIVQGTYLMHNQSSVKPNSAFSDNVYVYSGYAQIPLGLEESIFICGNVAYKIVSVSIEREKKTYGVGGYAGYPDNEGVAVTRTTAFFVLEECIDEQIRTLKVNLEHIRAAIDTCADSAEFSGGFSLANKFRDQAKRLMLEDMI